MADKLGLNYTHITTNATTAIIAGAPGPNSSPASTGILGTVIVNAIGTAWVATIYDGTVAQNVVIGVIQVSSSFVGAYFILNVQLKNGLTIVTSGTTPGDMTVTWS